MPCINITTMVVSDLAVHCSDDINWCTCSFYDLKMASMHAIEDPNYILEVSDLLGCAK